VRTRGYTCHFVRPNWKLPGRQEAAPPAGQLVESDVVGLTSTPRTTAPAGVLVVGGTMFDARFRWNMLDGTIVAGGGPA
jgi:hypothetical protein